MMSTDRIIILARKHVADNPENEPAARLHLLRAIKFLDIGDLVNAKQMAIISIGLSCGVKSRTFDRANRWK